MKQFLFLVAEFLLASAICAMFIILYVLIVPTY